MASGETDVDAGLAQALAAWADLAPVQRRRALAKALRAAGPAVLCAALPPAQRSALEAHAADMLAGLARLITSGRPGGLAFVREHARLQAEQRQPVQALLLAYRAMQAPLLHQLLDALPAPRLPRERQLLQALATEFLAAAGIVHAAEYVAHASVVAGQEGDRRAELLGLLVGGYDEGDARVLRLLKRAGYLEQRLRFCVALAQSVDPLEMENAARAQRIADALAECVAGLPLRVLVGVRGNLVTAVFSDLQRVSGWTAPQGPLSERVQERLLRLGPAVRVGLSTDQAAPALIARGHHEATVALDFADVRQRVVAFAALSIRRLLIHRGLEDVQAALPAWVDTLRQADLKAGGALAQTLRALADADINVQQAARQLRLHPNTVYARLLRIAELTGHDPRRHHQLSHLLLAMDCANL